MTATDPLSVVSVVLKTADNHLVLQQRDHNPLGEAHLRGKVGFFGGHGEPGESLTTTAVREIEEELELKMDPALLKHLGRFQKEFAIHGDHNFVDVFMYDQPVDPSRLVVHEGTGYVLVSPSNLSQVNLTPFGLHLAEYMFGLSATIEQFRH